MARLRDLAKLIRTKNAGPFQLTTDILFGDFASYRLVRDSGVITRELMARLFHVDRDRVHLVFFEPAYAIKVTIPRPAVSGDLDDHDVFGGQQYAPLVDLEIPEATAEAAGSRTEAGT